MNSVRRRTSLMKLKREYDRLKRKTGRTQAMLEDALQFVEPDCESRFRMAIIGRNMKHATNLMHRFADMLCIVGMKPKRYGNEELAVGNTRIRFVSATDADVFRWSAERVFVAFDNESTEQ